jgi:hypothetical protein
MRQRRNRIAVGLDGSPAARAALAWAAREAVERHSSLLVVTAWTAQERALARERGDLREQRRRLQRMQRYCVAEALADLPGPAPTLVARELVLADPVTALAHAAGIADTLVVGERADGSPAAVSTAALLARRLGRRIDPVPVVSVRGCHADVPSVLTGAA